MLSDPEKLNKVVRTGSMDDVGTRLEFLTELYELWSVGLDILERFDKESVSYMKRKQELVAALDMLSHHMQKDFLELPYHTAIDSLPQRGEDIKD
jgi:hypothetical protein